MNIKWTIGLIVSFNVYLCAHTKIIQLKDVDIIHKQKRDARNSESVRSGRDWWQNTVFYQIYPRSFKDSNGDGIGDLKGITEKLVHLKNLGIGATWLSPIFKSPMVDFGYDISDYRNIQEEYGTMDDFDELIREAKKLGIKIILDFVPNHCSDEHEWFKKSIKREPGYENYYIWHPGTIDENGERKPPNNWLSVFSGSAWEFNDERQEYYYHQFSKAQPDLNYREPKVVAEMKDVLRFWLDKGIYGFRVDAVPHLVEAEHLKDEPLSNQPGATPNDWNYLEHTYTVNQPENFDVIHGWAETLDDYSKSHDNVTRITMTEAYADIPTLLKYYDAGASFSFNFALIGSVNKDSKASDFKRVLESWLLNVPDNYTANWVMGNHDNSRIATVCGREKVDGLNMMLLLLPGVGVTYNGEEIGMENGHLSWDQHQDTTCTKEQFDKGNCRDFERTPFQWDDSHMAGFTTGDHPWLPVDPSYKTNNLKAQTEAKESHYHVYRAMMQLRKTDTLLYGDTKVEDGGTNNVLIVKRFLKDNDSYILIFNLDDSQKIIDLKSSSAAEIVVRSTGAENYNVGDKLNLNNIKLGSYEAYVLKSS